MILCSILIENTNQKSTPIGVQNAYCFCDSQPFPMPNFTGLPGI
jgi:hypothetical protein